MSLPQEVARLGKQLEQLASQENRLVVRVATNDVSNPPTDAELDTAFGTPGAVGAGFIAVVNDNAAGSNEYLVWSDGTNWFYVTGTKAT